MTPTTPQSSFLAHRPSRRDAARCGATLLVTLGILTVLSVMAVAFLITARLQRQTSVSRQNRSVARNYMDEALYQAVRQIENALTYPNYTDKTIPDKAYLTHQRLAPVGQWFSRSYEQTNGLNRDIAYQALDVLASPTVSNSPTVNLLTPQVMRYAPSILTNGLQLSSKDLLPFRSGWLPTESLIGNESLDTQLHSKKGRVAFLVFNCSGLKDANTFSSGPTTKKLQRLFFSQTNVFTWAESPETKKVLSDLNIPDAPLNSPFFHLSYDPDPEVYPLHFDCFETCGSLGFNRFGAGPTLDLNLPQAYSAMGALKEQATYCKFNLNSVTNFFTLKDPLGESPWFNDPDFKRTWLDPVTEFTRMMGHEEPAATLHRLPSGAALPWTIANFMDTDRIPQISAFAADDDGEQELATRVNYAVEDVPLINKVTVFSVFDPDRPGQPNPYAPKEPEYYDLPSGNLSNHYAVAVELWYPFAPNPPPGTLDAQDRIENTACYVGIYTNSADVQTTTNQPWSQSLLRDWLRWNYGDTSNTVMQTLFYSWGARYTQAVGPGIWAHPLWQTINTDSTLWFTTSMTNHMFWPVAETNGTYDITANPIWQAFYPETYDEVITNVVEQVIETPGVPAVTNQLVVVTTNVYTTLVVTNSILDWVVPPDSTNRMVTAFHGETLADYPWILWSAPGGESYSTNRMTGFDLADGTEARLSESNQLTHFYVADGALWVVVTNTSDGSFVFNSVSNLFLLDDASEPLTVSNTNFVFSEEISRVQPLPMPADLGLILDGLMGLLPTNSVDALNTFLMATPDDLDLDWDGLFDSLSAIPNIFDQLFPSNSEPTLGNMTEKDRHILWPKNPEVKTVVLDEQLEAKLDPDTFQGYFWTVYPKQTVNFMSVDTGTDEAGRPTVVTNYNALGAVIKSDPKERYTLWMRPVVTVKPEDATSGVDPDTGDVIVDEALLTHDNDNEVPVWGWTSVTNLYISEPRNNAFARDWRAFPKEKKWKPATEADGVLNSTNLNTDVHELPFIHYNSPFSSIGDIGHCYVAYEHDATDPDVLTFSQQLRYDTVTFSTRSGAALLDIFTLSPTNGPKRGLVQANTQQQPVIQTLLADVKVGWTNQYPDVTEPVRLHDLTESFKLWPDVYADALTNAPYSMGWRSYADMLPSLSTNELISTKNMWKSTTLHPQHDYTEDVLRGLVDKVSFRQNIFVIVVAAQALSPASTETHPIVLSDQRAAVTVIRDAYTGRWVIHSWVWLTE